MHKLTHEMQDDLGFYRIYPSMRSKLIEIDKYRFRPLGEENIRQFLKRSYQYCIDHNLGFFDELQFISLVMSILGVNFHSDPRYAELHNILSDQSKSLRVKRAHPVAMKYVKIIWGTSFEDKLERSKAILEELENNVNDPDSSVRFTSFDKPNQIIKSWFGRSSEQTFFVSQARKSAHSIGIYDHKSINLCFWMGWWLGIGFENNPLYPWIGEISAQKISEDEKFSAIVDFMVKRLKVIQKGAIE